jgi:hypothetical protein
LFSATSTFRPEPGSSGTATLQIRVVSGLRIGNDSEVGVDEIVVEQNGAAVCFLWVRDGSNKLSSRLESAEQIPRVVRRGALVRDGDARRIASLRLGVR